MNHYFCLRNEITCIASGGIRFTNMIPKKLAMFQNMDMKLLISFCSKYFSVLCLLSVLGAFNPYLKLRLIICINDKLQEIHQTESPHNKNANICNKTHEIVLGNNPF